VVAVVRCEVVLRGGQRGTGGMLFEIAVEDFIGWLMNFAAGYAFKRCEVGWWQRMGQWHLLILSFILTFGSVVINCQRSWYSNSEPRTFLSC
jgi:hypothetical protein